MSVAGEVKIEKLRVRPLEMKIILLYVFRALVMRNVVQQVLVSQFASAP